MKKQKQKIHFSLYHIGKGIFLVIIPNQFDLAMTFLRAQEFYESDSAQFKGKPFRIMEYIRWYAHKRGRFSYPEDWAGFNLPSKALLGALGKIPKYDDNLYDAVMQDIINKVYGRAGDHPSRNKFYLIGVSAWNSHALDHEIAHALYYLDRQYKRKTLGVINSISTTDTDTVNEARIKLKVMGYHKSVFDDEIQAYAVSGGVITGGLRPFPKKAMKEIRKIFQEHKPNSEPEKIWEQ